MQTNSPATYEGMQMSRVSIDHRIMGGAPCVRGTRIPVATILGLLAEGLSTAEVIAHYQQLSLEDVLACLEFAAAAIDERHLPLALPA